MTTSTRPSSHRTTRLLALALACSASVIGCGGTPDANGTSVPSAGTSLSAAVRDTLLETELEAAGTAEPFAQATLSTKLMGTVLEVLVREGDQVAAGASLLRIDARDLDARRAQVAAQLAEAQAVRADANTQAERMRRLFADSVATRAQLDAAETGVARANAAVRQVEAGSAELEATIGYAVVRAPFAGTVTRRLVDPGAFAAPGAPLLTVEDGSRLRVTASAAPASVHGLRRGQRIEARIEGSSADAVIEGVVPASGGSTYTVNAIVENRGRAFLPHSAAVLLLPQGRQTVRLIPASAVIRNGELTGVNVLRDSTADLRWIRIGRTIGDDAEVLSGLDAGERVATLPDRVR